MKNKYLLSGVVVLAFIGAFFISRKAVESRHTIAHAKLRAQLDNFSISITPSTVQVKSGTQQQFLVTETNVQNPNGKWSATVGSIDDNGLYTSPSVTSDTPVSVAFVANTGASAMASLIVISSVDGPATLPTNIPATSMADTPAPGKVTQVPVTGLQASLNAVQCGDTLMLQSALNYVGNFILPQRNCDDAHWIIIRSATADSNLPPEGTRINPCYAGVTSLPGRPTFICSNPGVMAKVTALTTGGPFALAPHANHYRLGPGLEITRPVGTRLNFGLIGPTSQQPADHIVVDRDWVHGTAQDETTRGLFLSGVTYAGVVDSYFTDFHCVAGIGQCVDAQAIAGGTGPLASGTFKIDNNFLEGAAETILFGGVLQNSATPADITIRRNHMFKPFTWMPVPAQSNFVGGVNTDPTKCVSTPGQCPFVVKNLFELKNAQRVLLEGNILEDVWPGYSQYGNSVLISGLNPAALTGQPVYSTISVESLTIRYNRIAHSTAGMVIANMAGQGAPPAPVNPNLPVSNVSTHDNIFDDMNPAYANGGTAIYSIFEMFGVTACSVCVPLKGIVTAHNTVLSMNPKTAFIMGSQPQTVDYEFINNIVTFPPGVAILGAGGTGNCADNGNNALAKLNKCLVPNYNYAGNVMIGATLAWPSNNFMPATLSLVQFANPNGLNGGDYRLLPTSPYKGKATDGTDPGADVAKVNAAIAGVN